MKFLSHYVEDAQTELFKRTGTFFAFTNNQFNEQKKDDVEYVSLGAGLICPKANVETLKSELKSITEKGIAQDLAENGKEKIIERELHNHECFYFHNITDAVNALKVYGITREEVQSVYNNVLPTIDY